MIKNCSVFLVSPIKVRFHFPKSANYKTYLAQFKLTEVEFDCSNSYITYSSNELENKISGSDSHLFKHFESMLSKAEREHDRINQFTRLTMKAIEISMGAKTPKIKEIAQELTLSVRA